MCLRLRHFDSYQRGSAQSRFPALVPANDGVRTGAEEHNWAADAEPKDKNALGDMS